MIKFTKEEIEAEIKKEKKEIEEAAFKLYCKDEISLMLSRIDQVTKTKEKITKEYKDRTIDKLRVEFNTKNSMESFTTIKDKYIQRILDSKNNS